ncbi:MAG: polymer-forming cytoskeletal protein [Acidobacteria bacterium]|nr:polymer-forming cytoskeletal protein [Acidobacteriota bacterium]
MKDEKNRETLIESTEITGFLDEGTEFNGEMKFGGTMRIDGKFNGKIKSDSTLIIGETASVKAELIEVGAISINGKVEGHIKAKERIEIHSRGKVYGSITAPSLIIDDGALLEGQCSMSKAPEKTETSEAKKK